MNSRDRDELQDYIDHMSTFNAKVGLDGKFIFINAIALQASGLTKEDLLKTPFTEGHWWSFDPDVQNRVRAAFRRAVAGEAVSYEENLFAFGKIITISFSLVPVPAQGGRPPYILAEGRDVSVLKEAEVVLRESEEKFRALAGSAADAIISCDGKGRVIYLNKAAERLFGWSAEEIMSKPLRFLMPERYREAHEEGFRRHISTGEARVIGRTVELAGLRKDGTEFPLEMSLSTWKTREGPLFAAILRDVTERKRAEEGLRVLNQDLERRAVELAVANKELESFSYSISHDLRAPLRAIDGFSRAVLEEEGGRLTPEGRQNLDRVCAATHRLGALIDDILSLSRITRREMLREEVDLGVLAREVLEDLRRTQPSRVVEVRLAEGLLAWGDRALLQVVLANLIGNAWKFTSKTSGARIELGVRQDPVEGRVFTVRDNGAGFDMSYVGKLFGAFQRLHTPAEFAGNGIGLAIVHRIIHRHGGRVWAEGAKGRGAVFSFTLPAPPA